MKIAIVEDKRTESDLVLSYIQRFEQENNIKIESVVFGDGLDFLENYNSDFDAIFMDIEMPHLNGMQTSERLRKINANVPLIFITNMKQFAINGYSVGATDFILKPVTYYRIETVIKKLLRSVEKFTEQEKVVHTGGGLKILKLSQIYYVEIRGHELLYHT
ncbi:MAG: LytTR family DNA-binding domain-containing protein, partial [Clostridia bacterium]|nr:LytTR family DNA-binding domain-containing protein [Clostridia bacterium]